MFATLTLSELFKMLEGMHYGILLIISMNVIIIALIFFYVFIKPIAEKDQEENSIHETAKRIIHKENMHPFTSPAIDELGLTVMLIEYDTMPEEWEHMWYALENDPINIGLNVHYQSATGESWDYKYTVLGEMPIHIFNHPKHPTDAKSKWVAISASPDFNESISLVSA